MEGGEGEDDTKEGEGGAEEAFEGMYIIINV